MLLSDIMRARDLTDPFPTFIPFSRRSEESTACGPVRIIVDCGKVKDRKRYKVIKPLEPLLTREPDPLPHGKGNSPRMASATARYKRSVVGLNIVQR